jgi:hypothetical protein
MQNDYKELMKFLKDSLESNTLQQSKLFSRKKIYLDEARSVDDEIASNKFSSAFRGFWIVDASDKSFEVNMFPNVANNYGDKLPLKYNMTFDFGELVNGCKFDFTAQAGKWIEVLFFHKGFAQIGSQELDDLEIAIETLRIPELIEVNTAPISVSSVSEKNKSVTINNIGAVSIFVGSSSDIVHADYMDLCDFVPPSESVTFSGSKQFSVRTFAGLGRIRTVKEK